MNNRTVGAMLVAYKPVPLRISVGAICLNGFPHCGVAERLGYRVKSGLYSLKC